MSEVGDGVLRLQSSLDHLIEEVGHLQALLSSNRSARIVSDTEAKSIAIRIGNRLGRLRDKLFEDIGHNPSPLEQLAECAE